MVSRSHVSSLELLEHLCYIIKLASNYLYSILAVGKMNLPLVSKTHLPPVEIEISRPNEQEYEVTANKRCEDPKVSPSVIKLEAQPGVKLIAHRVSTIRAIASRIVDKIARSAVGKVALHVVSAGLAYGRGEGVYFAAGADHWSVVQFRHHHSYVTSVIVSTYKRLG